MPPPGKRLRLTVDDFHRMTKAGILFENDHVELIEGQLFEKEHKTPRHAASVNGLLAYFFRAVGDQAIVSVQNAVRLSRYTELYPDIALLRPRHDFYASALPGPDAVLLIIEVADTSAAYDRGLKFPHCAAAGIPEAWLLNLPRGSIEVHREPQGNRYQQVTVFHRGERIALLALPEVSVEVDDILL